MRRVDDNQNTYSNYISILATGFAKIAWIRGVEVEHALVPQELLPIKPNKEYSVYVFMKTREFRECFES